MMRIKKWCPEDIRQLTILYYMGATDLEISQILTRSPQSLHKKITRLKLRVKNSRTHIITPKRFFAHTASIEDIKTCLTKMTQKLRHHTSLQEALLEKFPLHYKEKKTNSATGKLRKLTASSELDQWRSLEEIVLFLQTRKYVVKELPPPNHRSVGFSHSVNGELKRPLDLLRQANIIQGKRNCAPFYLENYTAE